MRSEATDKHLKKVGDGVTAIIAHGYIERRGYIYRIYQNLCNQRGVSGIVIWNNTHERLRLEEFACPATNPICPKTISSNFNTLLGRWAAVLLAETKYVLIQDDDLILELGAVESMLEVCQLEETMVGISGRNLNRTRKAYTEGNGVSEGLADVALGRAMLFHRSYVSSGLAYLLGGGLLPGRSDDIMFSLLGPVRPYIVPVRYDNLDEEGIGLSHEAEHMKERDEAAYYYFGMS